MPGDGTSHPEPVPGSEEEVTVIGVVSELIFARATCCAFEHYYRPTIVTLRQCSGCQCIFTNFTHITHSTPQETWCFTYFTYFLNRHALR